MSDESDDVIRVDKVLRVVPEDEVHAVVSILRRSLPEWDLVLLANFPLSKERLEELGTRWVLLVQAEEATFRSALDEQVGEVAFTVLNDLEEIAEAYPGHVVVLPEDWTAMRAAVARMGWLAFLLELPAESELHDVIAVRDFAPPLALMREHYARFARPVTDRQNQHVVDGEAALRMYRVLPPATHPDDGIRTVLISLNHETVVG